MCDLFIDTHLLLVEHLYQGCEQISCVNFDPKIVKKKKKNQISTLVDLKSIERKISKGSID